MYNKDDESRTIEEKIDSFMRYCRKQIKTHFKDLSYEAEIELDKFINLYGTHAIIEHLKD